MNFHYGQRVRCIEVPDDNDTALGLLGTVYDTQNDWIGVQFDSPVALGHTIEDDITDDVRGMNYTGWYCPPDTLAPIEELININELI